jgi:uncharacterized protein (UPF0332 family)
LITAQDFLTQAKQLINGSEIPEVNSRTAVSRAYYSLFHQSFEYLKKNHQIKFAEKIKKELDFGGGTDRVDYSLVNSLDRNYLNKLKINLHQIMGDVYADIKMENQGMDFRNFRDERNKADYSIQQDYPIVRARVTVTQIEVMINKLGM